MIKTKCPICGSKKNYEILYKSNFKLSDFNREIFSARRMPDRIHYQIVRCNKDGLVRSNPILSPSKLFKLYEVSSLDYGDETKNLANTYFNNLKKVLSLISKKDNILEIGCGNGFLLEKLSREGFKNVYGIEPSKDAVNKAKADIKPRSRREYEHSDDIEKMEGEIASATGCKVKLYRSAKGGRLLLIFSSGEQLNTLYTRLTS